MKDQHKNPTISFRISPRERAELEARILVSGMRKKDYIIRSCLYNQVCVVGKRETIYILVEKIQEMQNTLEEIKRQIESNKTDRLPKNIAELENVYMDMLRAILWMLDGAKYLWIGKE